MHPKIMRSNYEKKRSVHSFGVKIMYFLISGERNGFTLAFFNLMEKYCGIGS
jgi:hypothetical protein